MLNDAELVESLGRHWHYTGKDEDVAHEIYHPDAVLEFPQSGERFEGVHNFLPWRRRYPVSVSFHLRRLTRREDLVVAENLISYAGSPWQYAVNLLEFRGSKIAHERIYIAAGWEPAEWRRGWRSQTPADPPAPPPGAAHD